MALPLAGILMTLLETAFLSDANVWRLPDQKPFVAARQSQLRRDGDPLSSLRALLIAASKCNLLKLHWTKDQQS